MLICPKCHKQLKEGTKFCGNCGGRIYKRIFCPRCGKETSTEFAFCQNCGMEIFKVDAIKQKPKRRQAKKFYRILGIIMILILVIGFSFSLFWKQDSSSLNYTLYVKDQEIFFTDFSGRGSYQITSKLMNGTIDNDTLAENINYLDCVLSSDGRRIFFPDNMSDIEGNYTLCYKDINKIEEEGIQIDSDISSYQIDDSGDIVTYQKGEQNELYQYDIKKEEKEKIDSDIVSFQVFSGGKEVIYQTEEGGLYFKYTGKEKEKIESNISEFILIEDFDSVVYYTKEEAFYKKEMGKEKVKISSNILPLGMYESGEMYYLKSEETNLNLMDFIEDDMRDADASMLPPESPSAPSWQDYENREEYEAAYEAYETAYDLYEQEYEAYQEKKKEMQSVQP